MRPIYATNGEWVAFVHGGFLYDTCGEWVGWLEGRDVYTRDGEYVGVVSEDGRILRKRVRWRRPLRTPPPAPTKVRPPAMVPLAPMFAELPWGVVDVFMEDPDIFRHISELKPDWEG